MSNAHGSVRMLVSLMVFPFADDEVGDMTDVVRHDMTD